VNQCRSDAAGIVSRQEDAVMLISAGAAILFPDADSRVFPNAGGNFSGRRNGIVGANVNSRMPKGLSITGS
jgi:hypothetical protein